MVFPPLFFFNPNLLTFMCHIDIFHYFFFEKKKISEWNNRVSPSSTSSPSRPSQKKSATRNRSLHRNRTPNTIQNPFSSPIFAKRAFFFYMTIFFFFFSAMIIQNISYQNPVATRMIHRY
ncbi:LOW QUALITY PROTEIN: hypothetical protein PanWU01x14_240110 [Parasponia andersonii]|uniref:Transmembrane protein n=1 Tax=Parasponia andersonii TaxID=3476 RepID=A0A2P5BGT7_PARAD|nr:LOW QUALITY PROTEIN: hypothetical protein PanWU01x14_240110 [Parasponia andersonii]